MAKAKMVGRLLRRMKKADLRVLHNLRALPEAQRQRAHERIVKQIRELKIVERLRRLESAVKTGDSQFGLTTAVAHRKPSFELIVRFAF